MRKKVIAFATVVVVVATMLTVLTAFAFNPTPAEQTEIPEQAAPIAEAAPAEIPVTQTDYTAPNSAPNQNGEFDLIALMFDEDGQPVSKDVLEANLDKAIEDGYLNAEDKAVIIEMFDYCISAAGSGEMPCGPGMGGAGFSGCPLSR